MCVRVDFHVNFLVETFATEGTDERSVVGVGPHMSVKIRGSVESLSTVGANVGLHLNTQLQPDFSRQSVSKDRAAITVV